MKTFKILVKKHFSQKVSLGEVLMKAADLSPSVLGEAATKGAVWIQKGGRGKILRIRLLKEVVSPNDLIFLYYDPKVLRHATVETLECVYEDHNYGIWIKPAGVVPQGSQSGDHASLLRYVEKVKDKDVYLVHRLDRETEGLMLIAYQSKAAAYFSDLFQKNKIKKIYEAIVVGSMPVGHRETISASLDDKEAITHVIVVDSQENRSLLQITIETGRLHQIRRHLDFIGHPVMGDPKYGKGNKNRQGLCLRAYALEFEDPWERKIKVFQLPTHLTL